MPQWDDFRRVKWREMRWNQISWLHVLVRFVFGRWYGLLAAMTTYHETRRSTVWGPHAIDTFAGCQLDWRYHWQQTARALTVLSCWRRFVSVLLFLHRKIAITRWDRHKIATIFKMTFSNTFSEMKMYEFRFKFHRSLFLKFQLTIFQHWSR